jgi:ADP-ribose pyrophosphatase
MSESAPRMLASKVVYDNPLISVRRDTLRTQRGEDVERTVVAYGPAATVVALTPEREVLLVRQYRHPIGRELWEIPGGFIEDGETAERCALRELQEETGWRAENAKLIAEFYTDPAFSNHVVSVFLAPQLEPCSEVRSELEPDISNVSAFSPAAVRELWRTGEIGASWSLVGLMSALPDAFPGG